MVKIKKRIRVFFLNLFYRRLWARNVAILLSLAAIPVALLGVLLINTSQKAVRNSVLDNHKEIVARAAEEIGLFMKKPQDLLVSTASTFGALRPDPWKQETMLVGLVITHPIFMRVASLDLTGKETADSELGSHPRREYFKEALEEIAQGKTYVSKVKILDNHTPYITMGVPLKERGRISGALVAEVNLRDLWGIVDAIKIGNTGRAFLVSHEGVLIAHWDKKRVLNDENIKERPDIQSVLAGSTDAVEFRDAGGKWISSYAPIPGFQWGVVLRQRQEEAYAFSEIMKLQAWMIIILSEILLIVASIFMAKALARPIKLLASRLKNMRAGGSDNRIETKRLDEIGELARSFNILAERLKTADSRERLSVIGEASTAIAHELKNSLVSIKSFIQLFPERHKDERFVATFNKLIPEELKRWERMFKELSDFSSYGELAIRKADPHEILGHILEMMERDFAEKKIEVRFDALPGGLRIMADPEKLKQVFMNLIINAVAAMPQGGLLTISESLFAERDTDALCPYVEIKIQDTGVGIPRHLLTKIFEPFQTTKKDAMGLGLAISRRVITQHGGSISVESEVGAGTTFMVRLPLTAQGVSLEGISQ